ncbi:hypothetical protein LCGC14_0460910 [marine sediment metagenome]|uniref:Uncharacterized protein n=1 Tax=marine sediment metagenome TaxID=412755 RepID=A0A0F9SK81_9ZZZZ|nr:hypothetical protein [bacterium]
MNGASKTEGGPLGKLDPSQVTAAKVYDALAELKDLSNTIFEMQININEKLVNNPVDTPDVKTKAEVDRPVNPRHLPGFRDICGVIHQTMANTRNLQEYLISHI